MFRLVDFYSEYLLVTGGWGLMTGPCEVFGIENSGSHSLIANL